jgi:hypothetical protein
MKKTELDKVKRFGWLDGYQYLTIAKGDVPSHPELASNLITAVYIADEYKSFFEKREELRKQGVLISNWNPRSEPLVGPVLAFYMTKHNFNLVWDGEGKVLPSERFVEWERAFVECIRTWWKELPSGTRIYSQSAVQWLTHAYKQN